VEVLIIFILAGVSVTIFYKYRNLKHIYHQLRRENRSLRSNWSDNVLLKENKLLREENLNLTKELSILQNEVESLWQDQIGSLLYFCKNIQDDWIQHWVDLYNAKSTLPVRPELQLRLTGLQIMLIKNGIAEAEYISKNNLDIFCNNCIRQLGLSDKEKSNLNSYLKPYDGLEIDTICKKFSLDFSKMVYPSSADDSAYELAIDILPTLPYLSTVIKAGVAVAFADSETHKELRAEIERTAAWFLKLGHLESIASAFDRRGGTK
jgi:hypothetical protein